MRATSVPRIDVRDRPAAGKAAANPRDDHIRFNDNLVIVATVGGVSPVELPTPALSNRMTSHSRANPFVTRGSQSSKVAAK
jgi:hypothetical protein